jgi:molecular chaperone GrpE
MENEHKNHDPQGIKVNVHTDDPKADHDHDKHEHDKKEKECKDCRKLKEEVRHLKDSVEKLKSENAALDDSYRRKVADFDNYRKRMLKQMEDSSAEANRKLVLKIIPILDNFGRAIHNSETNKDFQGLYDGLKITNSEINRLFDDLGVKAIECVGKEFDPNLHEALMMEDRDDVAFDKTVVEELEKGYTLGDMVVRHSKVKVGKKKAKQ